MKSFFTHMSFPRAVILFCSLGSLTLGALVYMRAQRLTEVQGELKRVREVVKEIQADAYRLSDLKRSASSEKFKALTESETYIREVSGMPDVSMGQLNFTIQKKYPVRGIEDTVYKIVPLTKNQKYPRLQIANFLYRLEETTRRVKVTRLKLTPYKKVSAGETGEDQWVFEAEITTRTKLDNTPPAGGQG